MYDFNVHNTNDRGTRYSNCMARNFNDLLEEGKLTIQKWLEFKTKTEKNAEILAQELERGPLFGRL
jgi:hypothetical protein